jgi:hypothetical protein
MASEYQFDSGAILSAFDASDLNRPVARIAWLQPMLELERALLDAVRRLEISDDQQATALGLAPPVQLRISS